MLLFYHILAQLSTPLRLYAKLLCKNLLKCKRVASHVVALMFCGVICKYIPFCSASANIFLFLQKARLHLGNFVVQ